MECKNVESLLKCGQNVCFCSLGFASVRRNDKIQNRRNFSSFSEIVEQRKIDAKTTHVRRNGKRQIRLSTDGSTLRSISDDEK